MRRIYLSIALVCLSIALIGFWPTYFGPLVSGAPHGSVIIYLHAIVFMGWIVLMIAQARLAATGRITQHMKLGTFGFAWGLLVLLVGWATAISRFGDRVEAGDFAEAHNQLFAPLTDLLVFGPVLAAAWFYRRKPEIHKRLIVVGSTIC